MLKKWWPFFVVLGICMVFAVAVECGEYVQYSEVQWYPPDDVALQVFGSDGIPDLVIVQNPAENDFYMGMVFTRDAASDTLTTGQYLRPAAGVSIPANVAYLTSSTATDTLMVYKYRLVGGY